MVIFVKSNKLELGQTMRVRLLGRIWHSSYMCISLNCRTKAINGQWRLMRIKGYLMFLMVLCKGLKMSIKFNSEEVKGRFLSPPVHMHVTFCLSVCPSVRKNPRPKIISHEVLNIGS